MTIKLWICSEESNLDKDNMIILQNVWNFLKKCPILRQIICWYSAELSAEYSAKSGRIFGIGRYQFLPYRSFTNSWPSENEARNLSQMSTTKVKVQRIMEWLTFLQLRNTSWLVPSYRSVSIEKSKGAFFSSKKRITGISTLQKFLFNTSFYYQKD